MTDQISEKQVRDAMAMLQKADPALWNRYTTREKKRLPLTEDMLVKIGLLVKAHNPAYTAMDLAQLLSHMRQYIRNGAPPDKTGP